MTTTTLVDGRQLILASTSEFRRSLLERLCLRFATTAPGINEARLPDESAPALAARLAEAKARAVVGRVPNSLVIGSDQVAVLSDEILGKPGTHEQAVAQLTRASAETVTFHTGICVIDAESGRTQLDVVPYRVVFRRLRADQIERYLHNERPYQCAGSFKSEGLGITLFERLDGEDPTSLVGLPLIRLSRMLEAEGVVVL
jgi:septum formation protein